MPSAVSAMSAMSAIPETKLKYAKNRWKASRDFYVCGASDRGE